MKDGKEVEAKVLSINESEISYKEFKYQDGPTITVNKNKVLLVKYPNGTNMVLALESNNAESSLPAINGQGESSFFINDEKMYLRGLTDAKNYYSAPGATVGAIASGLVGGLAMPVGGLIIPFAYTAVSATSPINVRKNSGNTDLMSNPSYVAGFQDGAYPKRIRNLYLGAGISFAISSSVMIVALWAVN